MLGFDSLPIDSLFRVSRSHSYIQIQVGKALQKEQLKMPYRIKD